MKIIPSPIPDVLLIEPKVYQDARGFFYESYNQKALAENQIQAKFVQDNHSMSCRGVLRGLHFQIEPRAQAKLIRVVKGEIFDAVVDIRPQSPTFGKSVYFTLSAENKQMAYIPAGFAHGFLVLKDDTEVLYKTSDFYSPEHERGIIWNDPAIGMPWPKLGIDYILSEKDKKLPSLKELFSRS